MIRHLQTGPLRPTSQCPTLTVRRLPLRQRGEEGALWLVLGRSQPVYALVTAMLTDRCKSRKQKCIINPKDETKPCRRCEEAGIVCSFTLPSPVQIKLFISMSAQADDRKTQNHTFVVKRASEHWKTVSVATILMTIYLHLPRLLRRFSLARLPYILSPITLPPTLKIHAGRTDGATTTSLQGLHCCL